jgi:hypothetical protein
MILHCDTVLGSIGSTGKPQFYLAPCAWSGIWDFRKFQFHSQLTIIFENLTDVITITKKQLKVKENLQPVSISVMEVVATILVVDFKII